MPASFYETASGYKKKQEHHRGDGLSSDVYVGNCVLGTSGFSFCSTSELKTSLDADYGQRRGSSDNGRIGEELFPPFRLESRPLQGSLEKIVVSGSPIADQASARLEPHGRLTITTMAPLRTGKKSMRAQSCDACSCLQCICMLECDSRKNAQHMLSRPSLFSRFYWKFGPANLKLISLHCCCQHIRGVDMV